MNTFASLGRATALAFARLFGVSSGFWADSLGAIGITAAPTMDVPNPYALWFFLLANFGLTGLQLLWTQKIVKGVAIAAGLIKKPKRAD